MELGDVRGLQQPVVGGAEQSPEKLLSVGGGGEILSGIGKRTFVRPPNIPKTSITLPWSDLSLPKRELVVDKKNLTNFAIGESSYSNQDGTIPLPQGEIDQSLPPRNGDRANSTFSRSITIPNVKPNREMVNKYLERLVMGGSTSTQQQSGSMRELLQLETDMEEGLLDEGALPRNSNPNGDQMKLGKAFLAMTGQAVVSLMTYTQNGTSSYLAKTKWASYFVKAAIAVGFIANLIAIFLHRKTKMAADILLKIGIIATVCAFIVALGTLFIPA